MGIGVEVGVGVRVGAKLVWGTGARTMVLSSWKRAPPRTERSAYRRKPRLGAGVGVDRGPGGAALGISTLPSRVADTASRMTIKWEVKRERKSPSPTLALEVRILVLETQSFALDHRVAQRPIGGSLSVSPAGGKSAGISIRSPFLRQIPRRMSCAFGPDYNHKATNCQIIPCSRFIEHPYSMSPGILRCSWSCPAVPTEPRGHQ